MQILNYINKYEKNTLTILVFISIILKAIYVYVVFTSSGTEGWSDDLYYLFVGEQIVEGNWTPPKTTFDGTFEQIIVGPIIPLLVALFILLFRDPIIPFFLYNIVITSLMIPVLYYFGKIVFSKNIGWLMAIWGVFFIESFKYSPHVLKETTIFLFLPLTIYLLVKSTRVNRPIIFIFLASLSFSWLIHTDERYFIYLAVFTLIFLFITPLKSYNFVKITLLWISFVLLLMLPWGIKNYQIYGQVVILTPRTTAITSNLWGEDISSGASHFSDDEVRKYYIAGRYERAIIYGERHGITPREYSITEARIRAFINFWQPAYFTPTFIQYGFRPQYWSVRHNVASLLFYGIFLPFYILGMIMLYKRKMYIALYIAAIPVIHSILHAYMVWPLERYRSPVTFIVVMIGIYGMLDLCQIIKLFYLNKVAKNNSNAIR
jgi:hypothetical protein